MKLLENHTFMQKLLFYNTQDSRIIRHTSSNFLQIMIYFYGLK